MTNEYTRGDCGDKLFREHCKNPDRVERVDVSDWSVKEILEELAERGVDPADALIEYRGCGSHEVCLSFLVPKPEVPKFWEEGAA